MSKNKRSKTPSRQAEKTEKEHNAGQAKKSKSTGAKGRWETLPESGKWGDWVKYLASRPQPMDLSKLVPHAATHPLKWALPDEYEAPDSAALLKQLTRLAAGKKFAAAQIASELPQWLEQAPSREPDSLFAWQSLVWCHALPRLGQIVAEADWRALLTQLEEVVAAAAGISVHDDPVAHQLLNGELPLALAYTFPELTQCQQLVRPASTALSFGTIELMDGEGLPNARHIGCLRSLLACWTRCWLMSSVAGLDSLDAEGKNQLEWLIRQALRLTRPDGTLILSQGLSGDWCGDLFDAALRAGNDKDDRTIAELMLPGRSHQISERRLRKLPEPSVYSEWSETCVMRSRWSRKSPQFSCLFSERQLRTELSTGARLMWSGDSLPQLRVEGRQLAMCSDWTELCWFTDEDVDYLELEAEYEGGWVIQRQMLLARSDDVMFLADAVLGLDKADLQYDLVLPLVDDIRFEPEGATREGSLSNSRPLCTVLPLSLPEWKTAPSQGRLEAIENRLHLQVHESAQRLYVPLFFDLSPRLAEKRTWRQLSVAEQLEPLTRDVAVGYRIQLGRRQWLTYRSLAPRCNRSVLGQNLSHEFLFAPSIWTAAWKSLLKSNDGCAS